jgi:hypothetical protein
MAHLARPIVVLDTNLYVSYLITPSGPTARLVELGLSGQVFTDGYGETSSWKLTLSPKGLTLR